MGLGRVEGAVRMPVQTRRARFPLAPTLDMPTLRIIGDVHGQVGPDDPVASRARPYLEIIADAPYSVQVGDMGTGRPTPSCSPTSMPAGTTSSPATTTTMTRWRRTACETSGRSAGAGAGGGRDRGCGYKAWQ